MGVHWNFLTTGIRKCSFCKSNTCLAAGKSHLGHIFQGPPLSKIVQKLLRLEHSGRGLPILAHTGLARFIILGYLEGGISDAFEQTVSTGGPCPGQELGCPSAQPITIPIRGPACSTFLELLDFLCPKVSILWGRSLKFLLCPLPIGCLSQPLVPHILSDNPTPVIQGNSIIRRLCWKRAWKLLLLTTFLGWRRRNYAPLWEQRYRLICKCHIYRSDISFTVFKQSLI